MPSNRTNDRAGHKRDTFSCTSLRWSARAAPALQPAVRYARSLAKRTPPSNSGCLNYKQLLLQKSLGSSFAFTFVFGKSPTASPSPCLGCTVETRSIKMTRMGLETLGPSFAHRSNNRFRFRCSRFNRYCGNHQYSYLVVAEVKCDNREGSFSQPCCTAPG